VALFGWRKDICIISASETLAVEQLRNIKQEIETNPIILSLWGDIRGEKWTENHLTLKMSTGLVNIRAKGAGGQIRGFRPDCIILDDIETDESVESEDQRKKLKNWLFKACLNTLLPGGQLLIIGTLISPLSVLADLLDTPNGWVKKKYQAYVDGVEEAGHELWAEMRPHEWLQQRKKEIGSWAFASEYMNDPRADASAPIKQNMIRFWETLPNQMNLVIAVDPAYSDDDKADYKTAAMVGIDEHANRYLIDYVRTHNPMGEYIDSVINLYLRNKSLVTAIGLPNSGTEKQFFDSFLEKCNQRKVYPPVTELKHSFTSQSGGQIRQKKHRIIAALQPLFEQGKYFLHSNHYEARDELLEIGSSRHDDLVDCLAYCEQILTPVMPEPEKTDRYGYKQSQVWTGDYGY
jgi:phage terminase large subunit-like protein